MLDDTVDDTTLHSKKVFKSIVFYDNRTLKISKSKKSEQYFRDKIEIFICLLDEHFARHFESLWRETWRHTGGRTVQQISLEKPPPPPPWRDTFPSTEVEVVSPEYLPNCEVVR